MAWTTGVSKINESPTGNAVLQFSFIGDGTALNTDLFTIIKEQANSSELFELFSGKYINRYKTVPDPINVPSSTYEITLTDALGDIATLSARSITASQFGTMPDVSSSNGYLYAFSSVFITIEDIGNGNGCELWLGVTR
jgi:hypothetical protein